jgi:integration host factor subunit beta
MIRSELLQALAKQSPSMRSEEIERVVDVFFDEIAKRLAEGDSVEVPEKRVPYFKPGKDMRLRLNAE